VYSDQDLKTFFNFFSNLLEDVMKMLAEVEEMGAKFECVQKGEANLAIFKAELKDTFSQQPDAIHPPPVFLECSSIE
jgi:hypothetical protein